FGEGAHRTYTSTGPSDCHPGKAAFPTAESWTASVLRDAVRRADRDEKRLPELVRRRLSVPQDRIPARPEWPAQQPHPRLLRGSAALLEIAGDAGADDVLPRRLSALRTRNHVVEVELRAGQRFPAVLARVFVSEKDVLSREAHLHSAPVLEGHQHDHPRCADSPRRRADRVAIDRGEPRPGGEVEEAKFLVDRLGHPSVEQDEGAAQRRD